MEADENQGRGQVRRRLGWGGLDHLSQSYTCISSNVRCFTEIVINLQHSVFAFFFKKHSYSHALQKTEKCQLLTPENTYYR